MSSLNYLNNAQSRYDSTRERVRSNQAINGHVTRHFERKIFEAESSVPRDNERGNCLSDYSFSPSSTRLFVEFHADTSSSGTSACLCRC